MEKIGLGAVPVLVNNEEISAVTIGKESSGGGGGGGSEIATTLYTSSGVTNLYLRDDYSTNNYSIGIEIIGADGKKYYTLCHGSSTESLDDFFETSLKVSSLSDDGVNIYLNGEFKNESFYINAKSCELVVINYKNIGGDDDNPVLFVNEIIHTNTFLSIE